MAKAQCHNRVTPPLKSDGGRIILGASDAPRRYSAALVGVPIQINFRFAIDSSGHTMEIVYGASRRTTNSMAGTDQERTGSQAVLLGGFGRGHRSADGLSSR
jgi:hypothetical protein